MIDAVQVCLRLLLSPPQLFLQGRMLGEEAGVVVGEAGQLVASVHELPMQAVPLVPHQVVHAVLLRQVTFTLGQLALGMERKDELG